MLLFITNLLQIVANSKPLLIAAGLLEALSMIIMMRRSSYLTDNYGDGSQPPPDLWFGITDDRLFGYLSDLGSGGRKAYQRINSWDFFPYMPSYMIFWGALLLIQCRATQSTNISWIFYTTMILDLIETTIFNHATNEFPNRVSSTMIQVASISNQMKWISAGFGMISLLSLFVYNSMLAMKRIKKSHQQ